MELNELLEGETLTGRQATIIFVVFLLLIVLSGVALVVFSDLFRSFATV